MLLTGLLFTISLSFGITYIEIIVDPIEIWSAPQSRSRLEKAHFEKNFMPFYRVSQVILHAEGNIAPVFFFHSIPLIFVIDPIVENASLIVL